MKRMRGRLAVLLSLVTLAACTTFAGCNTVPATTAPQTTESAVKTVLGTTLDESTPSIVAITATKTVEGKSLFDAMRAWQAEKELDFTYSDSEFGPYLLSVNGKTPDAEKNEFWAIYTSLTTYQGVSYSSTEYGSYDFGGTLIGSASYGVSGLPLVEGCVYVLTIGTY
ncbi:MAG: hypothetical protein J6D37_04620 [Clostridia bacterium]|nr:hypothetical protein [Clostridia bacterium]